MFDFNFDIETIQHVKKRYAARNMPRYAARGMLLLSGLELKVVNKILKNIDNNFRKSLN